MVRYFKPLVFFAFALLMTSCSTSMKHTWTQEGFNGKNFDKILVFGASRNLEARTSFENKTVKLLADKGITAENSLRALPPITDLSQISEDQIVKVVKEGNYDGVIVAYLVDVNDQQVRETSTSTPVVYGRRGVYGYGRYVYGSYSSLYSTDYYRQQRTYVIETRLFDAKSESKEKALLWTGQSNIIDPSSFEKGAASYAKKMVNALLQNNIVR